MIDSEVGIYNLALNAIGARSNVSSPDENSREAEVCKLWYTVVRDQVLSAAVWPEATRIDYLALLNDNDGSADWANTNARPGYEFAYAVPNDCLRPQYLTNFSRFLIQYLANNKRVLATNVENAALVYTMRLETVAAWSSGLQMAIVYGLAAHISSPLTGRTQKTKVLADQANQLIWQARESAANSSTEQFEALPDWITGRGYCGAVTDQRFIYPAGELLMASSSGN